MTQLKGMRIWYFLPTMELGGSEKHVLRLASGLRRRGHPTGIVCLFREGHLADEVRGEGVSLVSLKISDKYDLGTAAQIFRWMRSHPMDILHTYLFGFHLFAGLPARILKVPVVLSSRRDVDYGVKGQEVWFENMGNFFVDRVICCAKAAERLTLQRERIQPKKVLTLYNGVDINRFSPPSNVKEIRRSLGIPDEAPVIGTVANLTPKKGYPYLLKAAEQIFDKVPSAWFLFVGFGYLEKELKEQAKKLSRPNQIVFTGLRHDIPMLLAAMDLFVLASLYEGLPNVLLEAMAMAKPVVATNVGGIPELIESGEDGLLVPPKDSEALASGILSFLTDPNSAEKIGLRAQEKIRKDFSLERMVEQYEALYLSLLKGGEDSTEQSDARKLCVESRG